LLGTLRPAEFVEGLLGRQRVRGVDPAALAGGEAPLSTA
jgi:hypothetical protein